MKITVLEYNVMEAAEILGCSEAEVFEWYGKDSVKLYFAERRDGNWSAYTGAQKADGSYAVYGLSNDLENITYEHMVAVLSRGF